MTPPPPSSPRLRWRPWSAVAVALILAAAVAIRLWSAWHARLSPEEASFWSTAVGIARAEEFPALGHSVSGTRALHPGPLFFWIIALSQIFVTSPFVANFFVSALALFGAIVLAKTADRRPALPADAAPADAAPAAALTSVLTHRGALLFLLAAAAPWWIVYSNSTWPSYVVTGVTACFLAALLRVAAKPNSRAIAAVGFVLIAGFQLHLSLLHFWPLALAIGLAYRPRLNRRWLVAGVLLACACYLPYLAFELRHNFANTRLLLAKSQGGPRSARVLTGLYLYFFQFPTTDISYLWQQGFWWPFDHLRFWRTSGVSQTTAFFRTAGPVGFLWFAHVLTCLVSAASLLVGAARLVAAGRRGRLRPDPLTLLYLVSVVDIAVFYALSGKGGYAHYAGVLLPVAFFPVASLLAWLARSPAGRACVVAYLAIFAIAGPLVLRGYYRVDSHLSAPQTARVVDFVLARTRAPDGRFEPFQLQFGLSPAWPRPYQILAQRLHHAPWLMTATAPHRFFVGPRDESKPAPDPDRLDLETIFVVGH